MKKVDEYYDKAKNQYGYDKKGIYNFVMIHSELNGLDLKKVEKYLNNKLKRDRL
jgi:hypothetical protein